MSDNDNGNPFLPTKREATDTALVNVEQSREIAEVQAAVIMAKRFPRDKAKAWDEIKEACGRKDLAEAAQYLYPRGGTDVEGPSIVLLRAIATLWGNMDFGVKEISNENGKSVVKAFAWDMERNSRATRTFETRHWRSTKSGGYALSDPRDIYELVANMGSRRERACLLELIPGDVIQMAEAECERTMAKNVDTSEAGIKKLISAWKKLGVTEEALLKRIGGDWSKIAPGQIIRLRKMYNSIKDGQSKSKDWFGEYSKPLKSAAAASVVDRLKGKKPHDQPAEESPPAHEMTDEEKAAIVAGEAAEEGMP